jgi:hypothetical protein
VCHDLKKGRATKKRCPTGYRLRRLNCEQIQSNRSGIKVKVLKPKIAQSRMIVGTAALRPMEFSLGFLNRQIINARIAALHQAVLVEFPVFIAVRTKPFIVVSVPLVSKADCDPVAFICPKLFYQAVFMFFRPFLGMTAG